MLGLCVWVDRLVCVSSEIPASLIYSCFMGFPAKLVVAASLTSFWYQQDARPALWISIYAIFPLLFNFFNVRRYGEIEFWLTTVKVCVCVGLIFVGILLAMGAGNDSPLLGTDPENNIVACDDAQSLNCLPPPGFICKADPSLH
jgi:amino acid permease